MSPILYYSLESPPCTAVLIAADAIKIQLELRTIDLGKGQHKSQEYLKINPQHTIPTLDDNGFIVVDSHAIITYLASKYGKDDTLYPKDFAKRSLIDSRLHFDSGVAFSILKITYRAHLYDGQTEYLTPWQTQKIKEVYDLVNTFLDRTKWVAGDSLTLADISLVTTVNSLEIMLPNDDTKYPNIRKWLDAASALPIFDINKTGNEQYKNSWKAVSTH